MTRTRIAGIGMYVPKNVVTNNDLTQVMDTSDEWIQERTGIKERRFATRYEEPQPPWELKLQRLPCKEQASLQMILTLSFLQHLALIIIFPVVAYWCNVIRH